MELYDNHIQIYISILQVLQSLSRDNHGIFISLVLFETWLCRVNNLQFFKAWRLASPCSISKFHRSISKPHCLISKPKMIDFQTQTEAILLNIGPKTTFSPGTKAGPSPTPALLGRATGHGPAGTARQRLGNASRHHWKIAVCLCICLDSFHVVLFTS